MAQKILVTQKFVLSLIKTKFIFCTNSNNHRGKCYTNNKNELKLEISITNTNQHVGTLCWAHSTRSTLGNNHLIHTTMLSVKTIITPTRQFSHLSMSKVDSRAAICIKWLWYMTHNFQNQLCMPCTINLTMYWLQHCKLRQIFQKAMCQ